MQVVGEWLSSPPKYLECYREREGGGLYFVVNPIIFMYISCKFYSGQAGRSTAN